MANLDFDWQIDEYMIYCRSRKLREKTMNSYEQALRLFERWCNEQMQIVSVDKVSDAVIRRYINDLQERGKYTFYCNDATKEINFPERRRDFRKPVSVCTINNYIRNLRAFFYWLDSECVIDKNPMRTIIAGLIADIRCAEVHSKMGAVIENRCLLKMCPSCIDIFHLLNYNV